jgi:hypothetical protein
MKGINNRPQLVESLVKLADCFTIEAIPESILDQATLSNPWFTRYYIQRSMEGIRRWLQAETLSSFLAGYDFAKGRPFRVGIIAAGNLPLVGFHDLLMGLLSGQQVVLKCSHQDLVLMRWVREQWIKIMPLLEDSFHLSEGAPVCDFLIATGSNNSARYFEARYQRQAKIIRRNRFSIAVVGPETEEAELAKLREDILLYNGLGCRNVSTLIVREGFDQKNWLKCLNAYPKTLTNSLYLERVLHIKIQNQLLNQPNTDSDLIQFAPKNALGYTTMGRLGIIEVSQQQKISEIPGFNQEQIQCQVGMDTAFGATQQPGLSDFADNVDTFQALIDFSQAR